MEIIQTDFSIGHIKVRNLKVNAAVKIQYSLVTDEDSRLKIFAQPCPTPFVLKYVISYNLS